MPKTASVSIPFARRIVCNSVSENGLIRCFRTTGSSEVGASSATMSAPGFPSCKRPPCLIWENRALFGLTSGWAGQNSTLTWMTKTPDRHEHWENITKIMGSIQLAQVLMASTPNGVIKDWIGLMDWLQNILNIYRETQERSMIRINSIFTNQTVRAIS